LSATVQTTLNAVSTELTAAGIDSAAEDARKLVAFSLGIETDRLLMCLNEPITHEALRRLDPAVADRRARKPVSHILGYRAFWGRRFMVTPEVLDPRPETETLIEAALAKPFARVLDLGTGSGCILLSLLAENADASGLGVDLSPAALNVAANNCAALGLSERAVFTQSDWFEAVEGQFDLIVINPPYIAMAEMTTLQPEVLKWEPMSALTPGVSGLEAYIEIAAEIAPFLSDTGRLLLEVGPSQAEAVSAIFQQVGLTLIAIHSDLDGRDRVIEMQ